MEAIGTEFELALAFLSALWEDKPNRHHILIWTSGDKRSRWFTDITEAARHAVGTEGNTYVGCCLSPTDNGPGRRCLAEDVSAIAGLWADVDFASGGAHKSPDLPPNEAAARDLIKSIGLEPTLIVHSGHGLQPWWLLKEPLVFESDSERAEAAAFAKRWERTVQARAKSLGWRVDPTADLARVLRVPGTLNCKTESRVLVRILENSGRRYVDWSDFEQVMVGEILKFKADDLSQLAVQEESGRSEYREAVIRENTIKEGRHHYILRDESAGMWGEKFRAWGHATFDNKDHRAWIKRQLKNIVVSQFRRNDIPDQTINDYVESGRKFIQAKANSEDVDKSLGELQVEVEGNHNQRLRALLNRIGGIPLVRIEKRGRDNSEYVFVLNEDEKIHVGDILNQNAVRKAVLNATHGRYLIPFMKMPQWGQLCKAFASLSKLEEIPDLDRANEIEGIIQQWLDTTTVYGNEDWQEGAVNSEPFVRDGVLHIHVSKLQQYIRLHESEKMSKRHILHTMSDLGFKRKTVGLRGKNGKTMSRGYWCRVEHQK